MTMTIQEVRRENLRWIIEHEYRGVQLKLASQVGLDASALSRLVRANAKGSFGDRLARRIERSIGKAEGWLDTVHIFTVPGGEFHMVQTPDAVVVSPFGHRMVPVVSAEIAAQWIAEPDTPYPMTERTQVDWVREMHAGSRTLGVSVAGEDMRDRFWPGDVVFIDPDLAPLRARDHERNPDRGVRERRQEERHTRKVRSRDHGVLRRPLLKKVGAQPVHEVPRRVHALEVERVHEARDKPVRLPVRPL